MSDDDDGGEFRLALDEEMRRREEELRALGELREEVGFAPRKSLARTPPQGFGTPAPSTLLATPPFGTPAIAATGSKRPLSSPAEVQPPRRRQVRAEEAPPMAGILTAAPAPTRSAAGASAVGDVEVSLADSTVEDLTALATMATKGIMDAIRSKTSKLNKDDLFNVGAHTERLGAVIAHLAVRLAAAEAKLQCVGRPAQAVEPTAQPVVSYAQKLRLGKNQAAPVDLGEKSEGPVLAFYPAADSTSVLKTADDTKAELKKAIDPAKIWVQVQKVRKVGNAGVVVQTTTKEQATRLKEAMPTTLRVAEPKMRQPLVCLNRIDGDPTYADVLSALHEQNYKEDPQWTLDRIKKEATGAFKKSRARGAATAVILACSSAFRESLISKGRVFIGWQVVEVTDYIDATCCKKCQQYGHPERYCRATEFTCGRCGVNGHRTEDCKSETTCCATCKRFGKPGADSHRTASRECPARAHAEKRSVEMTHYG